MWGDEGDDRVKTLSKGRTNSVYLAERSSTAAREALLLQWGRSPGKRTQPCMVSLHISGILAVSCQIRETMHPIGRDGRRSGRNQRRSSE